MKLIIIALFIIATIPVKAQSKVFTEEEFISVLKKYHPVAKQAEIDVRIAKANVVSARGNFDPVFAIDNKRKDFDGITYYDDKLTELRIPTWYGVDVYAGKENIKGSKVNPEETKGAINYLGFSVPLAQNLLMDKRRATLKQAKIFRDLSEVERRIMLNDLLLEGSKAYWDWWEQLQVNMLIQSAVSNAENRFRMVKTTYQLGDRPAIDTLEALTQVQWFRIKLSESYAGLLKSRLQLSTFLWKENDEQYELPEEVTSQQWNLAETFAIQDLLRASAIHPELMQYQFKLKSLDIDRSLKFQTLLPKINLKYNQVGYDVNRTIKGPWFENNYRFGISLAVPLRLSEGRGEYEKAKLKIDRTRLEQVNKQVQIYNKVKQYFTEWEQTTIQLGLQQSLLNNTASLQRGEETRFGNGESSLFMINSRELKTIETNQKLIELRAKNRKALLNMKWAAGLLGS